jgi:hypothetical protein
VPVVFKVSWTVTGVSAPSSTAFAGWKAQDALVGSPVQLSETVPE